MDNAGADVGYGSAAPGRGVFGANSAFTIPTRYVMYAESAPTSPVIVLEITVGSAMTLFLSQRNCSESIRYVFTTALLTYTAHASVSLSNAACSSTVFVACSCFSGG